MNTSKELAIRALYQFKGDHADRARHTFRNYTSEQMGLEYGQSGKSCAQILEEYEAHEHRVLAAIEWVKRQPD